MNKVYEIIRKNLDARCESMVFASILENGMARYRNVTDEDIQSCKGNGLMTAEFEQALVKTCRIVASECTMNDIIEFVLDRMDSREITYDRMSEIATLLKDGLMEDDEYEAKIYLRETVDMTEDEAEWFGVENLYDEEEDY